MGKIVKYCAACDESYAEKFAFCPNCAQPMTAFEMNPVSGGASELSKQPDPIAAKNESFENNDLLEIPAAAPVVAESAPIADAPEVIEPAPVSEVPNAAETVVFSNINQTQPYYDQINFEDLDQAKVAEPVIEDHSAATKTFAATAGATNGFDRNQTVSTDYQSNYNAPKSDDDGYHITVIEEKNVGQRNGLLLGTLVLMVILALTGTVYSLFNKDVGVGAIDGDDLFAFVPSVTDNVPMELDAPPPQPDPGKGGGGGGGGRKDDAPISKGELPPQFKDKPLLTPSKEDISVTDPALRVQRATRGPNDIIPKNRSAVNGDPNSKNTTPSNGLSADNLGMGRNGSGGIGNNGRDGVGSDGTGGIGDSPGNHYGNNPGAGGNNTQPKPPPPPPPVAVGPTEGIKILSKPQPRYTDAARTNNVQGTVTLKVTFSASGQVTGVAPISGLPYGLTEQAIAAARQIRFEPAKKSGVAVSVSKSIQYTFSIY